MKSCLMILAVILMSSVVFAEAVVPNDSPTDPAATQQAAKPETEWVMTSGGVEVPASSTPRVVPVQYQVPQSRFDIGPWAYQISQFGLDPNVLAGCENGYAFLPKGAEFRSRPDGPLVTVWLGDERRYGGTVFICPEYGLFVQVCRANGLPNGEPIVHVGDLRTIIQQQPDDRVYGYNGGYGTVYPYQPPVVIVERNRGWNGRPGGLLGELLFGDRDHHDRDRGRREEYRRPDPPRYTQPQRAEQPRRFEAPPQRRDEHRDGRPAWQPRSNGQSCPRPTTTTRPVTPAPATAKSAPSAPKPANPPPPQQPREHRRGH